MRIALLIRRFNPDGGGTERDLMVTRTALRDAGHDVIIYAGEVRGGSQDESVQRVPVPQFSRALAVLCFAYFAPMMARGRGADLLVSFARVVGADVLRSGGGAHVSYVRAAPQWRGRLGGAAMWVSPYHRAQMIVERRGYSHRSLKRAIGVSNLVRDDLTTQFGLPSEKVVTLYNGVDLARFRPLSGAARERLRQELGFCVSTPLVLFVGNGFGRKGLGSLLRAWPGTKSGARLIVAGNDRRADRYARMARRLEIDERVSFLGARERVEDLFGAADVFAMPSLFEPFGNVVMEAMACGLPALTSARSGVAELMPPEMREFVVNEPSDLIEIARRLDAMIERRREMAGVARAVVEGLTWKRHAEELLGILDGSRRPN